MIEPRWVANPLSLLEIPWTRAFGNLMPIDPFMEQCYPKMGFIPFKKPWMIPLLNFSGNHLRKSTHWNSE